MLAASSRCFGSSSRNHERRAMFVESRPHFSGGRRQRVSFHPQPSHWANPLDAIQRPQMAGAAQVFSMQMDGSRPVEWRDGIDGRWNRCRRIVCRPGWRQGQQMTFERSIGMVGRILSLIYSLPVGLTFGSAPSGRIQ